MKKLGALMLCLCLGIQCACAEGTAENGGQTVTLATLLVDLVQAYLQPSDETKAKIDADAQALDDPMLTNIAEYWKKVWLDPDYRLYMYGQDDPAQLPITGKHAFVVLGFQLENGEMTEELKGRCDAAAAAAKAFPDSLLVCSGGATGTNNPEGHTEAGLMKAYLMETGGIEENRIRIDERAMSTEENARNTLAILREEQIETMTIVTSSYHQQRGQTLYNAMAEIYRKEYGYPAEIVGNYCYPVEKLAPEQMMEAMTAAFQLGLMLGLSQESMNALMPLLRK
jgi:uncharacterized SAM-binding protein YcdF (DUF218 family)